MSCHSQTSNNRGLVSNVESTEDAKKPVASETPAVLEKNLGTMNQGASSKILNFKIGPEDPVDISTVIGNLYVAESGVDTNDCSQSKPCRQIKAALGFAKPGSTIILSKGQFIGFTITDFHGTADKPLKIISPGKNSTLMTTSDRVDNRDTLFISTSSYILIDGLNTTYANRAGVRVDQCDHITVRNGRFSYSKVWGIFTDFSTYSTFENNELSFSSQQHGLYDSNSPQNSTIRRNIVHDNHDSGIQINADASMGGTGLSEGNLIESNIIYRNGLGGGAAINLDGVQSSSVQNNLLYENFATGIVFYRGDGAAGPAKNNIFFNTVVMGKAQSRNGLLMTSIIGKNQIFNNIILTFASGKAGYNFQSESEAVLNDYANNIVANVLYDANNSFLPLTEWQKLGKDTGSFLANESDLFAAPSSGNYSLKAGSPALGKGQLIGNVNYDIVGKLRGPTLPTDIGAYAQ